MDWILLVQNMVQWRALANTTVKLWVPYKTGYFLIPERTISFSERTLLLEVSSLVKSETIS
jgi:hypothetical protein